jgi:hypothetical protein
MYLIIFEKDASFMQMYLEGCGTIDKGLSLHK